MYKIRKMLDELSGISGRGTELISVYIPKGKQLHEIISVLKEEQGTADNIKSDLTRTHVVDSLAKVVQRLRLYKKTPERGLVIFCGALPPEGGGPTGSETVRAFEIDPPKELRTFLYRCDDHFHVDILKGMLKDDNLIGFLAIDAKDAGWGLLRGDKVEVLAQTGSGVAGKHRQGGQSAKRFQKLREMELTYYYNRVAGTTREYFIDIYPIKGLIVSGPGPTKEEFLNGSYLEYRLQEMVIATLDTSYSGSEGIRESFAKSASVLSDFRMVEEGALVEKLFREVNSHSGLGAYGFAEVSDLLDRNVVETLLITDDANLHRVEAKCRRCGNVQDQTVEGPRVIPVRTGMLGAPCPSCNSTDLEASQRDVVDYFGLVAAKNGAKIEVISGKAEHGMMLSSLGKVAAILRYNPGY
ncbi:peptide chain release factor 1 [Cenarchaeum symbiosum A]|uniref:Peptide chain release factor subunit 1 n=1 Tax=Cenarchaeum symbiosum (strain A) TaxID=414004 RepID=A0RX46_CENSY|nr:peptide chain release factor 1 [Cenarchaeum symbiosum A]